MTNNQILKAILSINPNAEVNVGIDKDGVYDVTFHNGTTPISKADIEAKITELQTAYDNNAYQRDRAKEYPTLQEFAEAYCEKEIGNTSTKWDAYVIKYNQVRTENPKD